MDADGEVQMMKRLTLGEDWLAVVTGLAIIALVYVGLLKGVPW